MGMRLPRAVVCNVHGVRSEFLAVGQQVAEGPAPFPKGAYFLGKVLWAKGHRLLLDYLQLEGSMGLPPTHVDLYGSGEDIECSNQYYFDLSIFDHLHYFGLHIGFEGCGEEKDGRAAAAGEPTGRLYSEADFKNLSEVGVVEAS